MMMNNAMLVNTKAYPDASQQELAESLGLIPMWIAEFNIMGLNDLKEFLEGRYGYGLYEFNGTVHEDGRYISAYEDDEDLEFVGRMKTKDGYVYMYPYAITAIPTEDGYYVTRMD